jgi:hypothetical protein
MDNRAGFPFVPGFTAQTRAWVTGDAAGGGLRLEWQVDDESNPGAWTYTYRLLRGVERNKGFAFFDIETAGDFTAGNMLGWQVVSATDRFGVPIPSGLGAVSISDPVNFNAVHDFSAPKLTETSAATALNKGELSHYSGDPGRVAPGQPGSPASASPSVGPVPHPFYGIRVTFPGSFLDLAYEACAWEFRIVADRVPMWGRFFGWADQTTLTPFWYTNVYNDAIDSPIRLQRGPVDSLTGAGPYRGWILVPGSLPGVVANTPAIGAVGIPVTEPVSAIFRGVMDPATLTAGSFILTGPGGPVSGTVSYDQGSQTVTFQPVLPLAPNTTYTATIAAGVKDLAGNALPAPSIWSFTSSAPDAIPPSVTATLPDNGSTYVAITSTFSATFSEAVDPATITPVSFSVAGVAGTVGYDPATRTATFSPSTALAHNTTYTATVGTGIRDLAGNPLAAPAVWSVTTIPRETVLPFVVATFPAARSVNVVTTTPVSATFSEAIDPATLNASTFNVAGVTGTTSYDPSTLTATFTPDVPLAFNTSYTLTVTTGIGDLSGNPVGLTKSFSFRTLSQSATTFSASGTVTGPGGGPLQGVPLKVSPISQSGTATQEVVADATGNYTAASLLNGTYLIVPNSPGMIVVPRSISTSITNASVTGLNFTVAPLTLSPDAASPQSAGTPLSFAAAVVGGTETYQYQFWLKDTTGVYTLVQPFSSAQVWNWTTTGLPAGVYSVAVQVKAVGATPPAGFEAETVVNFVLSASAAKTLDVVTTPGSAQQTGLPVSIIATAGGGSGPYEYQFWLKDTTGLYTLVKPFSSSNVWNWSAAGLAPGTYSIAVQAKSSGSIRPNGYDVETVVDLQVTPAPATLLGLVTLGNGTDVTFTATASGGTGPYEYQFWLKDTTGLYTLVKSFSLSNVWNWSTAGLPAGTYSIAVQAKSSGSILANGFDVENVVSYVVP